MALCYAGSMKPTKRYPDVPTSDELRDYINYVFEMNYVTSGEMKCRAIRNGEIIVYREYPGGTIGLIHRERKDRFMAIIRKMRKSVVDKNNNYFSAVENANGTDC